MAQSLFDRVGPYLKTGNLGGIRLYIRSPGRISILITRVVWALALASELLGIGCSGVKGKEMPLSAIDGKSLSLIMDWTRRSPDDPTMFGYVSIAGCSGFSVGGMAGGGMSAEG
jgi:hypothetical protein